MLSLVGSLRRRSGFLGQLRTKSLRAAAALNTDDSVSSNKISTFEAHGNIPSTVAPSAGAATDNTIDVKKFLQEHQIEVKGSGSTTIVPFLDFDSTPFSAKLKKALKMQGYTAPTPIQSMAWALATSNHDMIAVAKTGSGKTCGFLLPAFHMLGDVPPAQTKTRGSRLNSYRAPSVLVVAPTRELAVQIEAEAKKITAGMGLVVCCLYGGASKGLQIDQLRRGADVIIATPGRCNDLAEMGALNLSKIQYLVLDEADRMLDMGFEPQIRQIVEQLPEDKRSLFFTATWPKEVQGLAADFLHAPVQINIGGGNDELNANKSIEQLVRVVPEYDKLQELTALLETLTPDHSPAAIDKTLIFVARKSSCEEIANDLYKLGYSVETLHGDKSQDRRTKAMDLFKSGRVKVLVATDVASRGIDVKDIATVINYDFPSDGAESYVHRIGRTGRAGATGTAYTFFTKGDASHARDLVGVMQRSGQDVPEELLAMASSGGRFGGGPKRRMGSGGYRSQGQSSFGARGRFAQSPPKFSGGRGDDAGWDGGSSFPRRGERDSASRGGGGFAPSRGGESSSFGGGGGRGGNRRISSRYDDEDDFYNP